ncbi:MAG TPA: hypothetical protein DCW68_00525 [Rhodospirillaceae bacterium]|nr:hypothetical protein [Rhodospirillaceae bacterium]
MAFCREFRQCAAFGIDQKNRKIEMTGKHEAQDERQICAPEAVMTLALFVMFAGSVAMMAYKGLDQASQGACKLENAIAKPVVSVRTCAPSPLLVRGF